MAFHFARRQKAPFAESGCEKLSCESISIHFSPRVFYAALKDIAHELGLGQLA